MICAAVSCHLFEDMVACAPFNIVGRHRDWGRAETGEADGYDSVGSRIGQRFQQDRVHHAEDRGGGANAERERKQGDEREGRVSRKDAETILKVLNQVAHLEIVRVGQASGLSIGKSETCPT